MAVCQVILVVCLAVPGVSGDKPHAAQGIPCSVPSYAWRCLVMPVVLGGVPGVPGYSMFHSIVKSPKVGKIYRCHGQAIQRPRTHEKTST
jgi:hypothetical protein